MFPPGWGCDQGPKPRPGGPIVVVVFDHPQSGTEPKARPGRTVGGPERGEACGPGPSPAQSPSVPWRKRSRPRAEDPPAPPWWRVWPASLRSQENVLIAGIGGCPKSSKVWAPTAAVLVHGGEVRLGIEQAAWSQPGHRAAQWSAQFHPSGQPAPSQARPSSSGNTGWPGGAASPSSRPRKRSRRAETAAENCFHRAHLAPFASTVEREGIANNAAGFQRPGPWPPPRCKPGGVKLAWPSPASPPWPLPTRPRLRPRRVVEHAERARQSGPGPAPRCC